MTVFPYDTSLCKISRSFFMSSKCKPVVGSSKIYKVFPVCLFDNSFDSLILCASPPERVVAA